VFAAPTVVRAAAEQERRRRGLPLRLETVVIPLSEILLTWEVLMVTRSASPSWLMPRFAADRP
jgi:hypothetical protein